MREHQLTIAGRETNREYAVDLARAVGGAVIFSVPIMMTMEMWTLGASLGRLRVALFTLLMLPFLSGISYFSGFESNKAFKDDVLDAFVAYAVGFGVSALIMLLFGNLGAGRSADEIIGVIALQTITASLGAVFTESLFSRSDDGEDSDSRSENAEAKRKRSASYGAQLFLMAAGAVFLSMSVAPTEEMILIGYRMSYWHAIALALLTLGLVHGFVIAGKLSGQGKITPADSPAWSVFLRYTVVGYAVALSVSGGVLWLFGQLDTTAFDIALKAVLALGFPAALGASASRLII